MIRCRRLCSLARPDLLQSRDVDGWSRALGWAIHRLATEATDADDNEVTDLGALCVCFYAGG